jgi:hypothetical protein
MENFNKIELKRRIGYWKHILQKIETRMLKEQSERVNIKSRLIHLRRLL